MICGVILRTRFAQLAEKMACGRWFCDVHLHNVNLSRRQLDSSQRLTVEGKEAVETGVWEILTQYKGKKKS